MTRRILRRIGKRKEFDEDISTKKRRVNNHMTRAAGIQFRALSRKVVSPLPAAPSCIPPIETHAEVM